MNTLRRASVASSALASVADACSQIARSISLSSDGVAVKSSWTEDSERRVTMSKVKENTDHRHEVMLFGFPVAHITDVRITLSGALVVG